MSVAENRMVSGAGATLSLTAEDVAATHALASALARQCRAGDCLLLQGDLGAGKTEFARGFIAALCGAAEEVVSPTFTLVQEYPGVDAAFSVWHFDLYRLKRREELQELGIEEALLSGIALIEWPQLAEDLLPQEALNIVIRRDGLAERRLFTFSGSREAWEARLNTLKRQS